MTPAVRRPSALQHRRAALLGAATLVATSGLLGGCGSEEVLAPPPPPPTATAAAMPDSDNCYKLAYDEALNPVAASTPTGAVKCSGKHTSQTFHVGTLSTVVDGHQVAIDSDTVQAKAATTCPDRLGRFVGASAGDIALSMLQSVWFTPSVDDSDLGASWVRCDVVVLAGEGKLATVTGSLKNKRAGDWDEVAMCGTDSLSAKGFARVPCAAEHSWRALEVVDIAGKKYPGEAAAKAAGQSQCKAAGEEVAADALDFEWSYEWPTKAQWAAGQTFGRCWAPV